MSAPLIALTGLIYLAVAVDLTLRGKYALACAYLGYSFSNIGLWYLAK